MANHKKPRHIILNDGRTLQLALDQHEAWLDRERMKSNADYTGIEFLDSDSSSVSSTQLRLDGENLSGADLAYCKLQRSVLTMCNLKGAYLNGADFSGSKLTTCTLDSITSERIDFSNSDFLGTSFQNCHLNRVSFGGAELMNVSFYNSHVSEADFRKADVKRTSFSGSTLSETSMSQTRLDEVLFLGSAVTGTSFLYAALNGCEFDKADLSSCKFHRTTAANCSFKQATLSNPSLRESRFHFCVFTGATIGGGEFYQNDIQGSSFVNAALPGRSHLDPDAGAAWEGTDKHQPPSFEAQRDHARRVLSDVACYIVDNSEHFTVAQRAHNLAINRALREDDFLSNEGQFAIAFARDALPRLDQTVLRVTSGTVRPLASHARAHFFQIDFQALAEMEKASQRDPEVPSTLPPRTGRER